MFSSMLSTRMWREDQKLLILTSEGFNSRLVNNFLSFQEWLKIFLRETVRWYGQNFQDFLSLSKNSQSCLKNYSWTNRDTPGCRQAVISMTSSAKEVENCWPVARLSCTWHHLAPGHHLEALHMEGLIRLRRLCLAAEAAGHLGRSTLGF